MISNVGVVAVVALATILTVKLLDESTKASALVPPKCRLTGTVVKVKVEAQQNDSIRSVTVFVKSSWL